MPVIPTGELIEAAEGTGIGAFNVITVEHAEAIITGAERAQRPVILQISQNAVKYHGNRLEPITAATQAVAATTDVPVALHLDHVTDPELWGVAHAHGYGSVMVDYSKLSYADNVIETSRAVEFLNSRGLWVESEIGEVGGKDPEQSVSAHDPRARTSPEEAAAYVAETGVDALAVAVGSSHAMTRRDAVLDHELIGDIKAAVEVPLVLHGSSGVPDDELRRAVSRGMVKINIGTALNVAFTEAVKKHIAANPDNVDPRKYIASARDGMADTVAHFLRVLAGR